MRALFSELACGRTRLLHAGSGPALLLLHGLGTTGDRWVRNIDALAEGRSVYAPDLLGMGFSADPVASDLPPQAIHVMQLEALVDALGIGEYAVVGSSYGGLVAALLHLRNPQRVTRLVIVGSGSALHRPAEQRATLEAAQANAKKATDAGTLEATRQRFSSLVFDPASTPNETLLLQLVANAQPGRAEAAARIYAALLASIGNEAWQAYPQLERISAPTLLITGRNDPRASWQEAEAAVKRIPRCSLRVYEDCGHAPMLEHPARFNTEVSQFLSHAESPAHA